MFFGREIEQQGKNAVVSIAGNNQEEQVLFKDASIAATSAGQTVSNGSPTIVNCNDNPGCNKNSVCPSPGTFAQNDLRELLGGKIKAQIVLDDGEIVCEYYKEGFDKNENIDVYGATRIFNNAIIGSMVKEGKISLDDTLEKIFNDKKIWNSVILNRMDYQWNTDLKERDHLKKKSKIVEADHNQESATDEFGSVTRRKCCS